MNEQSEGQPTGESAPDIEAIRLAWAWPADRQPRGGAEAALRLASEVILKLCDSLVAERGARARAEQQTAAIESVAQERLTWLERLEERAERADTDLARAREVINRLVSTMLSVDTDELPERWKGPLSAAHELLQALGQRGGGERSNTAR